jgi:hypothetical protein
MAKLPILGENSPLDLLVEKWVPTGTMSCVIRTMIVVGNYRKVREGMALVGESPAPAVALGQGCAWKSLASHYVPIAEVQWSAVTS